MIWYKRIDLWIQSILLLTAVIFIAFDLNNAFFIFYILLGGWQLLSCFTHLLLPGRFYPHRLRIGYHRGLVVALAIFVIMMSGSLIYAYAMLVIGLLMAPWYIYITVRELQWLRFRQIVHLKR